MEIKKTKDGSQLTVSVSGRIDTVTAPVLEQELNAELSSVTDLHLDFAGVQYISSAGLRVVLSTQKLMNKQGRMTIANVPEAVMEVFEITGFVDILTIL